MNYVMFMEHDGKEHETYFIYLQYDGNETELLKLQEALAADNIDPHSEQSMYWLDMTLITEDAVNQHLKLNLGSYTRTFQKCNGVFRCPVEVDDKDMTDALDYYLYKGQIKDCFTEREHIRN